MKTIFNFFFIFFSGLLLNYGCHNGKNISNDQQNDKSNLPQNSEIIEFVKPYNADKFKLGAKITFEIRKLTDTISVDSVVIFVEGKSIAALKENNLKLEWNSKNIRLGQISIQAKAYSSNGATETISQVIQILSDIKPKQYTYKIINIYPHDRNSYTQGLKYENGDIFESDGEYGKSALRKVKLLTGEVIKFVNMDRSSFAEGIAFFKNQIYQITWHEQAGHIYDKETFQEIRKFKYDISEGWGLEFDGKNFLMTDGSNNVYFMDPEFFKQVGKIEVMNDKGPVENLNELEIIEGKLYANVYQKNIVVIIDPDNGKVLGEIDFAGLLAKSDYNENTDVLNGIAWNPANGHLFITGKNWPKLFEVSISEKNNNK